MTEEYKKYMQNNTNMMVRLYIEGEDISGMTLFAVTEPKLGDYVGYLVDEPDDFIVIGKELFDISYSLLEQHSATATAPFYCSAMGVGSDIVCAKQAMLNEG